MPGTEIEFMTEPEAGEVMRRVPVAVQRAVAVALLVLLLIGGWARTQLFTDKAPEPAQQATEVGR